MKDVKDKEKNPSGELITVYTSLGKGRRECERCGKFIGARVLECVCGHQKRDSVGKSQSATEEYKIPERHVEIVLKAISWLDEYGENQSPENFFESLNLDWETLDQINSVEELQELKKRKKWALFLNECGGKEKAVEIVNKVGVIKGDSKCEKNGGAK